MKKIFSVMMLIVFCMSLAGCGETAQEKKAQENKEAYKNYDPNKSIADSIKNNKK